MCSLEFRSQAFSARIECLLVVGLLISCPLEWLGHRSLCLKWRFGFPTSSDSSAFRFQYLLGALQEFATKLTCKFRLVVHISKARQRACRFRHVWLDPIAIARLGADVVFVFSQGSWPRCERERFVFQFLIFAPALCSKYGRPDITFTESQIHGSLV